MVPPLFEVVHLDKIFPGGFQVLKDINLTIHENTCVVLAGSNGSGKTVLIKHLMGLLEPTQGTVFYKGNPLTGKGKPLNLLRQEVGLVFQDADVQIVGETVEEDIRFGPYNLGYRGKELEERIGGALDLMGLRSKREMAPRHLSGGEKRRLAIAGILAMGGHTIIMDEPFANLDYPGVVQVLQTIIRLRQEGKTLIICTHELEKVLAYADRLVVIHRGTIEADGVPEIVLQHIDPRWGIRDPRQRYDSIADCTWLKGENKVLCAT